MIKAIVFDFSGVLAFPANFDKFAEDFAKKSGKNVKDVHKEFHIFWQDWKVGKINFDFVIDGIINIFELDNTYKDWIKKYFISYYTFNKPMMEFVQSIKGKYQLYVLSNHTSELYWSFSKKFELNTIFDDEYISCDMGLAKPHKEIFEVFLKKTNLKANECIFIDNQDWNLVEPKKLGFHVVYYEVFDKFEKDMNKLL